MSATRVVRLSPSALARKMICPAYVSASMSSADRFRFQGFHAQAMIQVIKRHLKQGYSLMAVEAALRQGARVDLLFRHPRGQRRIVEVKSAKSLSEFHRLQAALYQVPEAEETVLSNGSEDIVLPPDYITSVQEKAHMVRQLLLEQPDVAAATFNPTPVVCRICANNRCPFFHASNEALQANH